jgi:hypothetical protein
MFMDCSGKFHQSIADRVGIDTDKILLATNNDADIIPEIVLDGAIDLLIVDTLSGINNPVDFVSDISYAMAKRTGTNPIHVILINNTYMDIPTGRRVPYSYHAMYQFVTGTFNMSRTSKSTYGNIISVRYKDLSFFQEKRSFILLERSISFPYIDNLIITAQNLNILRRHGGYVTFKNKHILYEEAIEDEEFAREVRERLEEKYPLLS